MTGPLRIRAETPRGYMALMTVSEQLKREGKKFNFRKSIFYLAFSFGETIKNVFEISMRELHQSGKAYKAKKSRG